MKAILNHYREEIEKNTKKLKMIGASLRALQNDTIVFEEMKSLMNFLENEIRLDAKNLPYWEQREALDEAEKIYDRYFFD